VSLFRAGDRKGVEALVALERLPSSVFDWCITQGMHITGTMTPFDFLTAISQHSLDGILHNVRQDVLLTEGRTGPRLQHRLALSRDARAGMHTLHYGTDLHGARGR
jgi:hypothetical protein